MKKRIRFPMRFKFTLTLLVLVTALVSFITFSTANLFQNDKRAYVNGLTSMVTLGAAEEARSLLAGYQERLIIYARIMAESDLDGDERAKLSRNFFNDFPRLIAVTLDFGEDDTMEVFNTTVLEEVGLSAEDFRQFMQAHPLPVDRIPEDVFVRNITLSDRLPALMLAYTQPMVDESQELFVSAILDLEDLLALVARFSGYEVYLVDSEGAVLADSDVSKVVNHERIEMKEELQIFDERFSAGITLEYEQNDTPMIGGFAAVDFGGLVAGAQVPRSAAYLSSRSLVKRLVVVSAALLMVAVLIGSVWANRITRPVERLSAVTRDIGRGQFDVQVRDDSRDEIGTLASSFNQMTAELKSRDERLQEAQSQLIQSEKMAAFGQLGAGIAHEVKNPLAGILACSQLAQTEVDQDSQVKKDLELIEKETKRCKEIIQNILSFARQERAAMEMIEINQTVEDAVAIIGHQLKLSKIKLETSLDSDLPKIVGNSNQLQQVFMNLMINVQQALEDEPGSLKIASHELPSGEVEVRFKDSGPGMTAETRGKLFEPFFTTKPNGKGTGLGLSVSFGIVREHGGTIEVESEPGSGAEFIITLPGRVDSGVSGSDHPEEVLSESQA